MRKSVFDKRVSSLFIVIGINLILFICTNSVESLCTGIGPNKDENLKNICDWSSWYPWNCSPCKSSNTNRRQFRKRAICCAEHVQLKSCLRNCNFSSTSDTQYANCSKKCDFKNGSLEIKFTDSSTSTNQHHLFTATTLSTSSNKQNNNKTLAFNTTVATAQSTDAENASVGVVIGAVFGSLIGIAILVAIIVFLKRKKR